jgi:hypothetical protein
VKIDTVTPPTHTVLMFDGEPGWPISKFDEIGVSRDTFQASYEENKSGRGQGRGEELKHAGPVPLGILQPAGAETDNSLGDQIVVVSAAVAVGVVLSVLREKHKTLTTTGRVASGSLPMTKTKRLTSYPATPSASNLAIG